MRQAVIDRSASSAGKSVAKCGVAGSRWSEVRNVFLERLEPEQRPVVTDLLRQANRGGAGIRMWLQNVANSGRRLPERLSPDLVQTYLDDPEAVPLHDCANCGLAIPVHPGCEGLEGEPSKVYFAKCPSCGGRTGLYAYWSNAARK